MTVYTLPASPAPVAAGLVLLTPADFAAEPCVTHHYRKPDGRWWWHCLTCNTSTQIRKHGRGHRTPAAAAEGADTHAEQTLYNKRYAAWYAHWWQALLTTTEPAYFAALWEQMYPGDMARLRHTPVADLMARVQSGAAARAIQGSEVPRPAAVPNRAGARA
jgi:hypothetical protein